MQLQCVLKKMEEAGSVRDKPRSSRPRAMSDRLLIRLSLSNCQASSKDLKGELQDALGLSVSTRTVRGSFYKQERIYCRPYTETSNTVETNAHPDLNTSPPNLTVGTTQSG